jgi:hypothetical protein
MIFILGFNSVYFVTTVLFRSFSLDTYLIVQYYLPLRWEMFYIATRRVSSRLTYYVFTRSLTGYN